jgi:hypothetical protein
MALGPCDCNVILMEDDLAYPGSNDLRCTFEEVSGGGGG